ncbi:hypothetical protein HUS23_14160 [Ectothiorhodospiraceae bacterium 2226]|nr:hypothetical protein HUS23_14160 [Ectothiorhodospiraceae bacterium 2226]
MLVRLPLALLAASILAALVPADVIGRWLGDEAGLRGILVATLVGGLLPGGPMVAFPLALVLWDAGAGMAQMVTLITAWSVIALHRVLAFEWPMLGGRFALLRLAASILLPALAGLGALGLLRAVEAGGALRLYG